MKELPKKPAEVLPHLQPQDDAVAKTTDRRGSPPAMASEVVPAASEPEAVLDNPTLLHPANAEPLAELLGHLQHSHGNSYVQQVVAAVRPAPSDIRAPSDVPPAPASPQTLDASTKAAMESAFGEDFGDVRLHTASPAQDAAAALDAQAFTRGRDIYFGAGAYDPASHTGREVLAHELAHVVQQRQGERGQASPASAAHEQEAHAAAHRAVAGQPASVTQAVQTSAVQRLPRTEAVPAHQPAAAAPSPTAAPQTRTPLLTPTIVAAVTRLLGETAFEVQQIALYIAPDHDRPRLLIDALALFPAAWQEITGQQPTTTARMDFLAECGRTIWEHVREAFLRTMDQRYQADVAFRRKVDHARHRTETPTSVPPKDAQA
jgi:hypothetical protein